LLGDINPDASTNLVLNLPGALLCLLGLSRDCGNPPSEPTAFDCDRYPENRALDQHQTDPPSILAGGGSVIRVRDDNPLASVPLFDETSR